MSFDRHIYVATGFLQHAGTRTRLIDLWQRLHADYAGAKTCVKLLPWDANWAAEAELVHRTSGPDPLVLMVAYSWGAGWGFTQLAKQLGRRGLRIRRACLIDPVYRHSYWLGNWRAFVPAWPIKVPANVDRVTWWRQRISQPYGHDLRSVSGKTKIDRPHQITAAHIHMDDHRQIMQDCYEIISSVMGRESTPPSMQFHDLEEREQARQLKSYRGSRDA